MLVTGFVSGWCGSTRCGGRDGHASRTVPCTRRWGWFGSRGVRSTARGRPHEVLVREPDAGNLHVRFDEREVKTGHGTAREAPADERAGNRQAIPKLPRHLPTLLSAYTLKGYRGFPASWRPLVSGVRAAADGPNP